MVSLPLNTVLVLHDTVRLIVTESEAEDVSGWLKRKLLIDKSTIIRHWGVQQKLKPTGPFETTTESVVYINLNPDRSVLVYRENGLNRESPGFVHDSFSPATSTEKNIKKHLNTLFERLNKERSSCIGYTFPPICPQARIL